MTVKTRTRKAAALFVIGRVLAELQSIARPVGILFAFVGGFFFVFSAWLLLRQPEQAPNIREVFQMSCAFLTAAWLLLRFASGLWPFGRRFFR